MLFCREVEQIGNFSGNVKNVVIQQKYSYLYDSSDGIKIIDIGNPYLPVEVGSINLGRDTRNLIVNGDYLYSIDGSDGLTIIDVSDKANPQEIDLYSDGNTYYDLKIKGSYAFGLTGIGISGSLKILDISNPSAISEVSQLSLTGTSLGTSLDIAENLLVITDYFNIHAIDVSDLNVPVLKSSFTLTGTNHIRLKGKIGFVSRSESGLDIYDFNDPEDPELIYEYDDADANVKYSDWFGQYLAVSDYDGSLRILDAFNPLELESNIQFNLLTSPGELKFYQDLIFLADGEGGLRIFEIDRNNLAFTPSLAALGKPNAAEISAAGTPPQLFLSISSYNDSRLAIFYSAFTDIEGTFEFTISSDDLPSFNLDSISGGLTQNNSILTAVFSTTLSGTILNPLSGYGVLCDIEVSGTGISQASTLQLSDIQFLNNSGQSYTVMNDNGSVVTGNISLSLDEDDQMLFEIYKSNAAISELINSFPYTDSGLGYGESNCYQAKYYFNANMSEISDEVCTQSAIFNNLNSFSSVSANSNGSCWGDYDNDGDADLFVTNYGQNILYRNAGSNVFTPDHETIFTPSDSSTACSWTDIDNDGNLDLFVSNAYDLQNELYHNIESGFEQITDDPILEDAFTSFGTCWFDADGDDTLDAFIPNYGQDNHLFTNSGSGTFASDQALPLTSDGGYSYHASCLDINGDSYTDIFVTNADENFLYYNTGEWEFTRIYNEPLVDYYSENIGASWGDYDNDGDADVFIAVKNENDKLFRNEGNGSFSDQSELLSEDVDASIGSIWLDYDNNGYLDLMAVGPTFSTRIYANSKDGFAVIEERESFQLTTDTLINTLSTSDSDNDGDLDLFFVIGGVNRLFENAADANLGNWLKVKPVGTISSKLPYGTKVSLFVDINGENQIISRWLMSQNGHNSQNDHYLHFGLGNAASIDSIKIYYSSGVENTLYDVSSNQSLVVTETDFGDVDYNGSVQAYDASILLGGIVENYELNRSQRVAGDVDLDDDIDHSDAEKILRSVLSLIELPDIEPLAGGGTIQFGAISMETESQITVPITIVNADRITALTTAISFSDVFEFVEFQWGEENNNQLKVYNDMDYQLKLSIISPFTEIPNGQLGKMVFDFTGEILPDHQIVIESVIVNDSPEQTFVDQLDLSQVLSVNVAIPQEFTLYPAQPNPFNASTTISFYMPPNSASHKGEWVLLKIYDIHGSPLDILLNEWTKPGKHSVIWNADRYPSGVYFVELSIENNRHVQKLVLLK